MSEAPLPQKNRRLTRRKPPKGRVAVGCYRGSWDMGENLGVSMLDVSESGVRLLVKDPLAVGLEVLVILEGSTNVRPLKRLGKVIWTIPAPEGNHCIGISFHKRVEYRELVNLT
jgi:hypothetical protein